MQELYELPLALAIVNLNRLQFKGFSIYNQKQTARKSNMNCRSPTLTGVSQRVHMNKGIMGSNILLKIYSISNS